MNDRKTLDQMTSNDLDQLYERIATAEQEADASVAAAAHLTTLVGKRSERAERNAEKQRRRADIAETELRVLRAGLRANGADPTQIQNLWAQIRLRNRQWREAKQRAEAMERAMESTAADALAHRGCHRDLMAQCQRAERAEADANHNADLVADAVQRAECAEAAIARVRALHRDWEADPGHCAHCQDGVGTPLPWPCPTLTVLDQTKEPTP
jgi:hypothetical protein